MSNFAFVVPATVVGRKHNMRVLKVESQGDAAKLRHQLIGMGLCANAKKGLKGTGAWYVRCWK